MHVELYSEYALKRLTAAFVAAAIALALLTAAFARIDLAVVPLAVALGWTQLVGL
jgi:hypothetical protein